MNEHEARGRFITFEGIDGAGKSTHLAWFAERLRERLTHDQLVVTREPGGTPLGERLREIVLNQPMQARTEALLMFAARSEHVSCVIEPALAAGRWVISDRFTDASFAYQSGGRGVPAEELDLLERFTHPRLQPDLTLLFDVDPTVAQTRRLGAREPDRFEAEAFAFHLRTREAYLARARAHPQRIRLINAERSIHEIREELTAIAAAL
ncbi:MAG TPA: dTMP kinase [Burkholderiaceae bacterium]|nr:dTMP kinase [Burkholderiaceae bacterium]